MCFVISKVIFTCLLISSAFAINNTKEAVGFPEMEEDPKLANKDNRQPVFIPAKCPINELYYPGDQKDDWICDCRPAHLFDPKTDKCWPAYQRGPCRDGEYLVLPADSAIPVCEKNPCDLDGFVVFAGKCYRLGTPCDGSWPHTTALEVSAANLEIRCGMISVAARFSDIRLPTGYDMCPPGCKRSINGRCGSITQ